MKNIIFVYHGGHIERCADVAQLPEFLPVGTHRQATMEVPYRKLVEVFGEPNDEGDSDRTDAEWCLLTLQGVATIYNYKDGKRYLGAEGLPVEEITEWHIGGYSPEIVPLIKSALSLQ